MTGNCTFVVFIINDCEVSVGSRASVQIEVNYLFANVWAVMRVVAHQMHDCALT